MQEFIELANTLADAAGEIIKKYYRTPFNIEQKGDMSPVTVADRAVEKRLREILEDRRPQDGILGEEFGRKESQSGLTWVIDPIDGTKSFMIGRPTFGTLIALCEDDVPKLGVIDQAISAERWVGVRGEETIFYSDLNARPPAPSELSPPAGGRIKVGVEIAKTRPCSSLNDAIICSTTPSMFDGMPPYFERFHQGKMAHGLIWGGDCYMYGLLASGHLDMTIEAALSPYDFAALVPVVEGAGGIICDYAGNPLTLQSSGQVIALGDSSLLPEVLKKLDD
ncbi:MAG: inositol monophosphatase family protein [Alphaproteobacteria bacterium]